MHKCVKKEKDLNLERKLNELTPDLYQTNFFWGYFLLNQFYLKGYFSFIQLYYFCTHIVLWCNWQHV